MPSCEKKSVLGVWVDPVNYQDAVDRIITAARGREGMAVTALAVHGVMTGALNPVQRYRLNHLDMVVPDGQPVRWALNLLYHSGLEDRVYGPQLMLELCDRAAREDLSIFLYGSRPEVLESLSRNLRRRYPGLRIAGMEASRFRKLTPAETEEVVRTIQGSGAAMVFVGLGCPRQEVWAYEYRDRLNLPVVAVGAAFDFHAGLVPQAPPVLQKWGLEWAFRLVHEPRRLWRRYMYLNPLYLGMLALQAMHLWEVSPLQGVRPAGEIRYG